MNGEDFQNKAHYRNLSHMLVRGWLLDTFFTIVQCFTDRGAYRGGCDRETSIR